MDKQNRKIEQVYNQYKDHIYNYIYHMCNDQQLAMDLVQQTFVKVLSKPEILEVEHLKAYLFTIARNKLHDEWKQKTTVSLEGDDMMLNDFDGSAADDVQKNAEQKATKSAVINAIKQLPNNLRELMLLRYTEDLTVAEISGITKRTVTDIKVSLHRARLKFEEKLTALMYSKVAVARNRCKPLTELLLPFGMNNIPEEQLAAINKHIIKCEVCIKDTVEMKQSKQLFTALPLLPFPIAFDELVKSLPPSAANLSGNQEISSAVDSTTSTTATVGGSLTAKVVGGSLAIILVGGLGLYFNDNTPNSNANQNTQQATPTTKTTENNNTGTIKLKGKLTGKINNSNSTSDMSAKIEWNIYPLDPSIKNKPNKAADSKKGREVSFNLTPGKYQAVARLGEVVQSTDFEITAQQTQTKSLVLNAGLLNVKLDQSSFKDINVSEVEWVLVGNSGGKNIDKGSAKQVTFKGNKPVYLPPGEYQLSANHPDNLEKIFDVIVVAGEKTLLEKLSFNYSKLTFNAVLAGKKNIAQDLPMGDLKWELAEIHDKLFKTISQSTDVKPSFLIAPGEYRISVQLNETVKRSQRLVVKQGQANKQLNINLNAGRLALKSKMLNNNLNSSSAITWSIDDLTKKKTNPVYRSHSANPQLYLPVGKYRVTANAGINSTISRTVNITAGQTRESEEFIFNPGSIKLAAKSAKHNALIVQDIHWTLEQRSDEVGYKRLTIPSQVQPLLVLKSGRYRITALYANRFEQLYEFTIKAGETTEHTLLIKDDFQPSASW